MNIETTTEAEAMELVYTLARKFDWVMSYHTRGDIVATLQTIAGDYKHVPTEEEVSKVMSTRIWKKTFESALEHTAWECMQDAIYEAKHGEI
jgi:hypothetical protein